MDFAYDFKFRIPICLGGDLRVWVDAYAKLFYNGFSYYDCGTAIEGKADWKVIVKNIEVRARASFNTFGGGGSVFRAILVVVVRSMTITLTSK